jgi:S1-C subfamily serine protease
MIRAILAAVAVLCLASIAHAQDPVAAKKLWDQVAAPTAKLSNSCTAEIIYSNRDQRTGKVETLVLTAKHCVDTAKPGDTQTVDVTSYDGRLNAVKVTSYLADVAGKAAASDVALLRLRDKETYFEKVIALESAEAPLLFGEDVIAVGYPRAMALTLTRGALGPIDRINVTGQEHGYLRSSTDIAPGSSGGGLYHIAADGDWKLIGIATAGVTSAPFMTFFTSIDEIEAYLKVAAPQIYADKK